MTPRSKASPKKTAWLTLSEGEVGFTKSLCLQDILKPIDSKKNGQDLWTALVKMGFFIHPLLMAQYNSQSICIVCHGAIDRIEGAGTYERRCVKCHLLYEEGELEAPRDNTGTEVPEQH